MGAARDRQSVGDAAAAGAAHPENDAPVPAPPSAAPPAAQTPEQPASGTTRATGRYQFFNHAACEFYPCHDMPAEELNCLFCFCPLYALGPACGGTYRYVGEQGDIKDCSDCVLPHRRENYGWLMGRYAEIQRLAAPEHDD